MKPEQIRALLKAWIAIDALATANGLEWTKIKVLQQQVEAGAITEDEMVAAAMADLDDAIDRLGDAADAAGRAT